MLILNLLVLFTYYVFFLHFGYYIYILGLVGRKKNLGLSFHGFLHIGHFGVVFSFNLLSSLLYAFFMSLLPLIPVVSKRAQLKHISINHRRAAPIIYCYHLLMVVFTSDFFCFFFYSHNPAYGMLSHGKGFPSDVYCYFMLLLRYLSYTIYCCMERVVIWVWCTCNFGQLGCE